MLSLQPDEVHRTSRLPWGRLVPCLLMAALLLSSPQALADGFSWKGDPDEPAQSDFWREGFTSPSCSTSSCIPGADDWIDWGAPESKGTVGFDAWISGDYDVSSIFHLDMRIGFHFGYRASHAGAPFDQRSRLEVGGIYLGARPGATDPGELRVFGPGDLVVEHFDVGGQVEGALNIGYGAVVSGYRDYAVDGALARGTLDIGSYDSDGWVGVGVREPGSHTLDPHPFGPTPYAWCTDCDPRFPTPSTSASEPSGIFYDTINIGTESQSLGSLSLDGSFVEGSALLSARTLNIGNSSASADSIGYVDVLWGAEADVQTTNLRRGHILAGSWTGGVINAGLALEGSISLGDSDVGRIRTNAFVDLELRGTTRVGVLDMGGRALLEDTLTSTEAWIRGAASPSEVQVDGSGSRWTLDRLSVVGTSDEGSRLAVRNGANVEVAEELRVSNSSEVVATGGGTVAAAQLTVDSGGTVTGEVVAEQALVTGPSFAGDFEITGLATFRDTVVDGTVRGSGAVALENTVLRSALTHTGSADIGGSSSLVDSGAFSNAQSVTLAEGAELTLDYATGESADRLADTAVVSLERGAELVVSGSGAQEAVGGIAALSGVATLTADGAGITTEGLDATQAALQLEKRNGGSIHLQNPTTPGGGAVADNIFLSTPDGLRWVANAAGEVAEATVATTSLETAGADDYVRVDGSLTSFAGDVQVAGVMVDSASPIEVAGTLAARQLLFTSSGGLAATTLDLGSGRSTIAGSGTHDVAAALAGTGPVQLIGGGDFRFAAASHSLSGEIDVSDGSVDLVGDSVADVVAQSGASLRTGTHAASGNGTHSGLVTNRGAYTNDSLFARARNEGGTVVNHGGLALVGQTGGTLDNHGSLGLAPSASPIQVAGVVNNFGGTVQVAEGEAVVGSGQFVQQSGAMIVDGSIANSVTLDGGTLSGSGSIDGALRVGDGATVLPGSSPGDLSVGSLLMEDGASLILEVGSAESDRLLIADALSISSAAVITIAFLEDGLDETLFQSEEKNLSDLVVLLDGGDYGGWSEASTLRFEMYDGTVLESSFASFADFMPVPEPDAGSLLAMGLAWVAWRRSGRQRRAAQGVRRGGLSAAAASVGPAASAQGSRLSI